MKHHKSTVLINNDMQIEQRADGTAPMVDKYKIKKICMQVFPYALHFKIEFTFSISATVQFSVRTYIKAYPLFCSMAYKNKKMLDL